MKKKKKLLQSITLGLLLGGSLYAAQPAWAAPTFSGGTGTNSTVAGVGLTASGNKSLAAGYNVQATGENSIALGIMTAWTVPRPTATGKNSIAIGVNAYAYGESATSIGTNSYTTAQYATAVGYNAQAYFAYASAFGAGSNADAAYSTALGYSTLTEGMYATAVGYDDEAHSYYATSVGYRNMANHAHSSAMGDQNRAYGLKSSSLGSSNITGHEHLSGYGENASSVGNTNTALGYNSNAFGSYNTVGYVEYEEPEEPPVVEKLFLAAPNLSASSTDGEYTTANADYASAMGYGNAAYGNYSSAFGTMNTTGTAKVSGYAYNNAYMASAMGVYNEAYGSYSSAVGCENKTYGNLSSAVGYENITGIEGNSSAGNSAAAMGAYNKVYSNSGSAIGRGNIVGEADNYSKAAGASAIGGWNEAYGEESSAIGQENEAYEVDSSAVGGYNRAYGRFSAAMGSGNVTYTDHSVALGFNAHAGEEGSTEATSALAIGLGEVEYDEYNYPIWNDEFVDFKGGAFATAKKAIAIGYNTTSSAESAIAIGTNANAELKDSLALGSESVTGTEIPELGEYTYMGKKLTFAGSEPMSVLSVGAEGKERRITNVAAGRITSESTDAINGSQLYALAGVINSRINDVISGMPSVEAGENITVDVTETSIGGEPGSGTEIADTEEPAEITQKTYTVNGEGGGGVATEVKAGKNIASVDLETAADGHNIYTVNAENMRVTGGSVSYDANGNGTLGITSGEGDKAVTTEIKGLKNNVTKLDSVSTALENNTNLKVGVTTIEDGKSVTKESSVDLSDLQTKQGDKNAEDIAGLKDSMADQSGQINRLGNRINKVGAGAAALAAMHSLDYDPHNKLSFSAGIGSYRSETAAAVGMFYRPSERVMFNLGSTVGNDNNMVSLGVNFALDRKVKLQNGLESEVLGKAAQDTLRDKVQKLENENAQMKDTIAAQDAKMAAQDAKMAAQDAKIAKLEALVLKLAK